jgi:hypothetical protein
VWDKLKLQDFSLFQKTRSSLINYKTHSMASDVYGSMSVTLLSVLTTKAAEMISEISGTPVNLVAKH